MIRKIFPLLFFSFLFAQANAQEIISDQYHVYLRDGSFLNATQIVKDWDQVHITLQGGESISIPKSKIDRISKQKKGNRLLPSGITIQEKGIYQILQTGILLGKGAGENGQSTESLSAFNYICGYQANKYLSLGLGVGVDFYNTGFIPVQLDYRAYFINKKISLYAAVGAGYSITFDQIKKSESNQSFEGGALIHPAIGMRIATRANHSFLVEYGYRFQYATLKYSWGDTVDSILYKRSALRVSVLF